MPVDVSVIVTSYNVADYIARAIDSALSQTGVTIEVIVVDDASTDGTWAAIKAIPDPRVKAFKLNQNSGPSVARNAAIAEASGKWLAVLDGDDQFLPGRLERLVARAQAEKADIIVDNLQVVRATDGASFPMFAQSRLASMKKLTPALFIAGNVNFIRGYGLGYLKPMFSAAFLKVQQLKYRESIRIGEDYVLLLDALLSGGRCVVEPTEGYAYTVRESSISHRLTLADVERIQSEDSALLARHALDGEAISQQCRRECGLLEAYAYNQLLDVLKARDVAGAFRIMMRNPSVAVHLWSPLLLRIRKRFG